MSIFNEEQIKAMFSREYICHECGHLMEFEDEWEDTDKSKTPAVRAKHARNAEEFYTLYNEVNCILQDIISLDESKDES